MVEKSAQLLLHRTYINQVNDDCLGERNEVSCHSTLFGKNASPVNSNSVCSIKCIWSHNPLFSNFEMLETRPQ